MSDQSQQAPSEPVPGNAPEARTPEGTLVNQTTTTEPQTTTEPGTTTTSAEPKAGAPETYADFRAPEGGKLDAEAIAAITPLFKELNLTQDQAQKIVDAQAAREATLAKTGKDAYDATRETWKNEAKAEFGTRLQSQVLPTIGQAIQLLPEADRAQFRQAMDMTGAGDNPAFIRAFYGLAKLVTEGKQVSGSPPPAPGAQAARPTLAGSLYPNHVQ